MFINSYVDLMKGVLVVGIHVMLAAASSMPICVLSVYFIIILHINLVSKLTRIIKIEKELFSYITVSTALPWRLC